MFCLTQADDLGRVVIPKEIRRTMRIREGDPLEIYTSRDGEVIFKKYSLLGGMDDFAAQLCETMSSVQALDKINFGSRDNTRRPFCWSGQENGGFTTGKPWIPVHSDYKSCNLEADLGSEKSVWRFYRDVLHLRKTHTALSVGSFEPLALRDASYCAYTRTAGDEQITVVCNFEKAQELDIPDACGEILLSNYGRKKKNDKKYEPYEVAVFWRKTNG